MELGTLGIALVVVIGVPLITAGYAFLAERLLKLAARATPRELPALAVAGCPDSRS